MGVLDFSRPALGKLAIRAVDAGRCEPPNAEKGYAVRRDFRGFTGPLFEARCRVRAPQPGVVGVEKTGPRQSLLPAGFWNFWIFVYL